MSKSSAKSRQLSRGQITRIYFTYWGLIVMIAVLALVSIGFLLDGTVIVILSLATFALAGIATFLHVKSGKKDSVDDIAKRMK